MGLETSSTTAKAATIVDPRSLQMVKTAAPRMRNHGGISRRLATTSFDNYQKPTIADAALNKGQPVAGLGSLVMTPSGYSR